MKEIELRKHAKCSACGKKILSTGLPILWTVTVERHGLQIGEIKRVDALGEMLGSATLGRIMGPDPELTTQLMLPTTLTLCDPCASESIHVGWLAMEARAKLDQIDQSPK